MWLCIRYGCVLVGITSSLQLFELVNCQFLLKPSILNDSIDLRVDWAKPNRNETQKMMHTDFSLDSLQTKRNTVKRYRYFVTIRIVLWL